MNKGIKLAKGQYIARMDADDISLPERFDRQIKFMQENTTVDVCGSSMQIFGKNQVSTTSKAKIFNDEIKVALLFNSAPKSHNGVC